MEIPAAAYTRGHMYVSYVSYGVYEAQLFRIEHSYVYVATLCQLLDCLSIFIHTEKECELYNTLGITSYDILGLGREFNTA